MLTFSLPSVACCCRTIFCATKRKWTKYAQILGGKTCDYSASRCFIVTFGKLDRLQFHSIYASLTEIIIQTVSALSGCHWIHRDRLILYGRNVTILDSGTLRQDVPTTLVEERAVHSEFIRRHRIVSELDLVNGMWNAIFLHFHRTHVHLCKVNKNWSENILF